MLTKQEAKEIRQITTIERKWACINQDAMFCLVTLSTGTEYDIIVPLKCAVEIESKGFNIKVLADAE